jgi:acetyl esterase/lipase
MVKPLGPSRGVLQITHVSHDGRFAYARFAGLTMPPTLLEISLKDGVVREMYASPMAAGLACPEPELLRLKASDGTEIPIFHWHAPNGTAAPKSVLIMVHGGLHTQMYPTWEAYLSLMLENDCDVVAVNYRGSSGYGQKYESLGGDGARTADILAAIDYSVKKLKVASTNVFIWGHSRGAGLAACAAGQGPQIGGLILASWAGRIDGVEAHFSTPLSMIEFHGADDIVLSPKTAKDSMANFFAPTGAPPQSIQQVVFGDEGHFYYRTETDARIYWETLKMMGRD